MCKGKISAQINPWYVFDFSSDIFLAQSSLRKSLTYVVDVVSTILGTLIIVCYNLTRKIVKPHAQQLNAHICSFFDFVM